MKPAVETQEVVHTDPQAAGGFEANNAPPDQGMQCVVVSGELYRVLKNAMLFVSRNKRTPWINAVWLNVTHGRLAVGATDRYVMTQETIDPPDDHGRVDAATRQGDFALRASDAEVLLKMLPQSSLALVSLEVGHLPNEAGPQRRSITAASSLDSQRTLYVRVLTYPPVTIEFFEPGADGPGDRRSAPPFEMLRDHEEGRLSQVVFNPHHLARLAKVVPAEGKRHASMQIILSTPVKPAKVKIGSCFQALVMPVRTSASGQ